MFKFWWILNIWFQLFTTYAYCEEWYPSGVFKQNVEIEPLKPTPEVYFCKINEYNIVIISKTIQTPNVNENQWSYVNYDGLVNVIPPISNYECYSHMTTRGKLVMQSPKSISSLPKNLVKFIPIHEFSMNNFGLRSLSMEDFNGAYFLESINLSNNSIVTIPPYMFSYTPSIHTIDMSNNEIENIPENAFELDPTIKPFEHFPDYCRKEHKDLLKNEGMKKLNIRNLLLNNNRLHFVDAKWFASLENLMIVSLAFNKIQIFDATTVFANNLKLTTVDLRNNRIKDVNFEFKSLIRCITLSNNPVETPNYLNATSPETYMWGIRDSDTSLIISSHVSLLEAGNNSITSLVAEGTHGQNILQFLKLDNNKLSSITNISHFKSLEVLILANNLLTTFETEVFKELTLLRQLDLSYNKLKHFHLTITMPSLEELHLSGNGLTTLDTSMKYMAPKLILIGLKHNDWNCQYLATLILILHSDGITSINKSTVGTANTPDSYKQIDYDDNVKGVECFNSPDATIEGKAIEELKNEMEQLFDQKLSKLQERLFEMIKQIGKI